MLRVQLLFPYATELYTGNENKYIFFFIRPTQEKKISSMGIDKKTKTRFFFYVQISHSLFISTYTEFYRQQKRLGSCDAIYYLYYKYHTCEL